MITQSTVAISLSWLKDYGVLYCALDVGALNDK